MAKNKIKFKLEIIALLLLIIATLLGLIFVKKTEVFELEDDYVYYVDGMDYSVPSGSTLKEDNKTNDISIIIGEDVIEPNGLPLYSKNSNSILLVNDMAYYKPNTDYTDAYKLSYYTKLDYELDSPVTISRDDNSRLETKGFLFDGNNTYVFLEETIIQFGNYRVSLAPFSYVVVSKGCWVEYYDYSTKEVVVESNDENVFAKDTSGLYSVILDLDILDLRTTQIMLSDNIYAKDFYFEAAH